VTKKFVAYYRVSTDKQEHGIDAQRNASTLYVSGIQGELISEFSEKESGSKDDRPELRRAMKAAADSGATLLIAKLDRLSRSASFLLNLRDSGVPFVCADMPDANQMTVGIMAVVAEEERRMISKRTKEGLEAAKAKGVKLGRPLGSKQPDGWDSQASGKAKRAAYSAKYPHAMPRTKQQRETGRT